MVPTMKHLPERQVYTVLEFARIFGIGRNQAYAYVKRGLVPKITIGKREFIPKQWVDDRVRGGEAA
jgi:hypothetical protein